MGTYEQWLLIYAPGHDYMKRAINRICDEIDASCENKTSYTESVWSKNMRGPTTTESKEDCDATDRARWSGQRHPGVNLSKWPTTQNYPVSLC